MMKIIIMMTTVTTAMATMTTITIVVHNNKLMSCSFSTFLNLDSFMVPFKHIHKISTTVIYTFQENCFSSLQKLLFQDLIT